jgi:hypothetical protein
MQTKENPMTIAIIAAAIVLAVFASAWTIVEIRRDGFHRVPTRHA